MYLHEHLTRFLPTEKNRKFDAAIAKLDGAVEKVVSVVGFFFGQRFGRDAMDTNENDTNGGLFPRVD